MGMNNTNTTQVTVGCKVSVTVPQDAPLLRTAWWPKEKIVTGTVQKIFKNGLVAVAIDQLGNRSEDGKHTIHLPSVWLSFQN